MRDKKIGKQWKTDKINMHGTLIIIGSIYWHLLCTSHYCSKNFTWTNLLLCIIVLWRTRPTIIQLLIVKLCFKKTFHFRMGLDLQKKDKDRTEFSYSLHQVFLIIKFFFLLTFILVCVVVRVLQWKRAIGIDRYIHINR